MFYQCYDCKEDVDSPDGTHYEVDYNICDKHENKTFVKSITLCKGCFDKRLKEE